MPNFEEIWPSNKDKNDKYKRRLIGMEYYLDAMEHHGLKGHLPQPENFTTCGKLGIEINQYNCPIEVSTALELVVFTNQSSAVLRRGCDRGDDRGQGDADQPWPGRGQEGLEDCSRRESSRRAEDDEVRPQQVQHPHHAGRRGGSESDKNSLNC